MKEDKGLTGMTRRDFIRGVGHGGMAAAAALAVPGVAGAQSQGEAKAQAMPKRKLGRTGMEVSTLCLGGMFDTINNQLLLKQAFNWGVTIWDTAEAYGNGLSEEGFGRFFSRNPDARKEIFLITKTKPAAPESMTASLDKSLKRLQTDHVELFLTHAVGDLNELGPAVREWSLQMKKAGKTKLFGFSTHTNMEDCLLAAAKQDWIDAVMFTYNFRIMNTPKMKEALAACVEKGIGLIAMKSQAAGPGGAKPESEAELQLVDKFVKRGFTDKQGKLKAVWENPTIASICSQMPNLTILAANVAAARDQTRLSRSDFHLLDRYAFETRCGYCAGCTAVCSAALGGQVPVGDVMRYLMYYHEYGERAMARDLFAALPEDVRSRLGEVDYGRAEASCPQGLAIADLMRSAVTILG